MLTCLSFSERSKNKCESFLKLSSQTLYLLDPLLNFDVFSFIPRNFTLTTKNGSSNFNIDMLNDTSSVIAKYIQENPKNTQYQLEIDDQQNVLGKFEEMYHGKVAVFYKDDIPVAKKITSILNISCIPNFLLPVDPFNTEPSQENRVSINRYCFSEFIKKDTFKTFTIKTLKNEYKCNFFGVCASKIINKFRKENPTKNQYLYEFDDEFGEFQSICDLFNFLEVEITVQNMNSLKEISDHLQIEIISNKINDFINKYEKLYYKIDKQQDSIDLINDLFDLLYHIKERTVKYVKSSIVQSFWCETEENVQELAAFILQVVDTDIVLHRYLADLIEQLNEEANDENELKILVPFIVKKLMFLFGETSFNCSFIYNLFKRGLIPKEEIINQLKSFFIKVKMKIFSPINLNSDEDDDSDDSSNIENENLSEFSFTEDCVTFVVLWFLPEIIEINKFNESLLEDCDDDLVSFIQFYLPDKIEDYKKMRDKGEPTDIITIALRNDDVDTLQSIISCVEKPKLIVPFNIYENFVPNGKTNFLNYSAAYGSVKCFKYLLLNYLQCDDSTFSFAVYGGNTEIIKIVDYQKNFNKKENEIKADDEESNEQNDYLIDMKGNSNISNYLFFMNYNFNDRDSDLYKIIPSITKHQNNLFDWIFEQKFSTDNKYKDLFNLLIIISAQNGNAYSLISMINFGFKISKKIVNKLFQISSKRGFYRLSKIIYKTLNKSKSRRYRYYYNCIASVSFGNLSIFKFYLNLKKTQKQLEKAFILAVKLDHRNIIKYYFDKLVTVGFKFRSSCVNESMNASVLRESSDLFFYLIDQFNKINHSKIDFSEMDQKVLSNACAFNNIEAVKTILDSLISAVKNEQGSDFDSSELDLTDHFQTAAVSGSIEICQYFLDKKVSIDFNQLSTSTDELSTVNEEIFSLMLKNSNYIVKQQFLHFFLEPAIENKNFGLVEFLLKENVHCENALFIAVQNDNLKMINLILEYKKESSFINKSSGIGTALCVAVKRGVVEIVKALLSSNVINPSLRDENGNTPLMIAFPRLELMNPILDFYGDSIVYQTQQIHFLIKKTLHLLNSGDQEALPILERILNFKNINPNELINDSNFLFYACKNNNTKVLSMLLDIDSIDLNIFLPETGDTPLIVAVENNCTDVAEILIKDKRADINAKNYANKTALSIAFYKKNDKIIDALFNNENFDPKNGCLDEIFKNVDIKYQKKILSNKSFDVNHLLFTPKKIFRDSLFFEESTEAYEDENEYKSSETILNYAVRANNKEIFDFVIQNPSFDKEKSDFKFAIGKSIKDGKLIFFKKLLNLINNEINEYDVYQKTLLCCAIYYDQIEIVKEILNHPNFDSKKNKMFDNFCTNLVSLKQNTYEIMKLLYSYDKDHDNLIDLNNISSFGETVFTSINCDTLELSFLDVDKIVDFLLNNGSDPNIPNKKGKYPLQHAIELDSYKFVCSLLKSSKIDLTKRMKSLNNESFLHLAAILKDSSILKEFLDKNEIDINSTNDFGETPLMLACRFHRKDNIKLLFEKENLDFLHCNKQGNDALKIVQIFVGKQEFATTKNKNDYCNLLLDNIVDIEFTPIDIDDSLKQNFYPYLSRSEKIEFFKDFNTKSEKIYSNEKEKNEILNFIDNSGSVNKDDDDDDETEANYLSSSYSENVDKMIKLYSSSNNSSVKDFSNLEGISSVEKNSKGSYSQENNKTESSSRFLLEFTSNSNDTKNSSQQNNENSISKKLFDSSKLPSLHKKSEESSKNQDNSSNIISINIDYSMKQRDEISQHPLNKPNSPSKDKISILNESDQKHSITPIKAHLPDSYINTSPRTLINKIKNLQTKSDNGDPEAQYLLGIFYSIGKGVPVDKEKSFNYYLMAAKQGHMNAQYSAATCYSYGKGTEVDKEKAFKLYLSSAEKGLDKAQFAVGHFYEFGQGGVEKNHEIAVEWYQKAANQGHKGSIEALNYK